MALSVTSPIWQQVNTPALDMRRYISSLIASEGIVASGDLTVAQRSAGANMSVDVSSGRAMIQGDLITHQGFYFAYNDSVQNVTGFSAANATNPRIDRVCLRVRDAFHGDAANDVAFVIVTGTATSGATLSNLSGAGAVPASHLLLANVLIPASATTITTANIENVVALVRTVAGGPGQTQTTLPSSPGNHQQASFAPSGDTNVSWLLQYDTGLGDAYKWRFLGGAAYEVAGTSLTVPLAGLYTVEIGAQAVSYGPNNHTIWTLTAGGITLVAAGGGVGGSSQGSWYSVYDSGRTTTVLTAGQVLTPVSSGTDAPTTPYIRITPVRVA
jgi:hypothetical protein